MGKRSFVWLLVLLFNIGVVLSTLFFVKEDNNIGIYEILDSVFWNNLGIYIILTFVSLTALSVWVSGLNFRRKNWIGYGFPALLLLTALPFFYIALTCSGMLCGVVPFFIGVSLFLIAFIFFFFYTLGRYIDRWSKFSLMIFLFLSMAFLLLLGIILAYLTVGQTPCQRPAEMPNVFELLE